MTSFKRSCSLLIVIVLVHAFILAIASARNFEKEIPYDKPVVSPDGALAVTLLAGQNPVPLGVETKMLVNALSIKNRKTGQVVAVYIEGPPYLLEWTKDSKTIVTVEHVAGGNTVNVYNDNGTSWKPTELGPPTKLITHCKAVAVKTGLHSVRVTFIVEHEHPENHAQADVHEYTIVADANTGATTKVIQQRTTR